MENVLPFKECNFPFVCLLIISKIIQFQNLFHNFPNRTTISVDGEAFIQECLHSLELQKPISDNPVLQPTSSIV